MRTERRLGQRPLVERADEIGAALLAYEGTELGEPERSWLRDQYAEVVPAVLVDALRSVDTGRPLPEECLARARTLGAGHAAEQIPLGVALRSALPALRVSAAVLRDTTPAPRAVQLMHRAGVVIHELVSAWVEGWLQARPAPAGSEVEVPVEEPQLDPQERLILQLAADGRSNSEIAEATHYSRQAVTWHLSRLMRRWQAPNRTALVAAAFTRGVLGAPARRR